MSKLGEVFVEILGDADPFANDFAEAIGNAGDLASEELTGSLEAATDQVESDLGEAGDAGGAALVDGIEGSVDGLDIDASDAFDGVVGDAEDAGDSIVDAVEQAGSSAADALDSALDGVDLDVDTSGLDGLVADAEAAAAGMAEAFDGVADQIQASIDGVDVSGLDDSLGDGGLSGTTKALGGAMAGVGLEAFARQQAPLTEQARRLAASLGLQEDEVRSLASSLTNVTRPLDQVLDTMEIGRQQGLESTEQLEKFVTAWDTVGDATGENASQLASSSKVLAAFGIEADNVEDSFSALGFIQEETTTGVQEFMDSVQRIAPEMGELDLSLDQAAATMGILEREMGLTGRVARRELQQAVREADGDMNVFLDTLGISAEQWAEYNAMVEDSSGVIERNADIFGDSFTPMQRFQTMVERTMFRFEGLGQAAGLVAAPIGALGPMMLGLNQTQQLLSSGMGTKLVAGLKAAAGGFRTLAVAIFTNPLFLIGAVIIGLIAIIWHFRDEIIGALTAAWDWVRDITSRFWSWLTESTGNAINAVVEWFTGLRDRAVEVVQSLVDFIVEYHPAAILFRLAEEFGPQILAWFGDLVESAVEWVLDLRDRVIAFVTDLWQRWVSLVHTIRDAVVGAIRGLVSTVVSTVSGWVSSIVGYVTDLWRRWTSLVQSIRDAVVGTITGLVSTVTSTVSGWVSNLLGIGRGLRTDFVGTIRNLATDVLARFRALPGDIVRALGNLGSLLFDSGRKIIEGLIRGITNMAGKVKDAVKNVLKKARDLLPFSPAKEGPFSGRGWTLYAGQSLIEGIADGIVGRRGMLVDAMEGTLSALDTEVDPVAVDLEPVMRAPAAMTAAGGSTGTTADLVRQLRDLNAQPIDVTLDLGEGITARYRIERTREANARAVVRGGR